MRAFLAVEISEQARSALAALQEAFKPRETLSGVRWVRPENLHLTLRFLGSIEPEVSRELAKTLAPAVNRCQRFTYALRGGGGFPNAKRPRVVWVGVDPVPEGLVRLHRVVEAAVEGHGFTAEPRGFSPHLTIARVKTPDKRAALVIHELEGRDFGLTDVSQLVLFESRLSPRGASYRAVERFELGGTDPQQLV